MNVVKHFMTAFYFRSTRSVVFSLFSSSSVVFIFVAPFFAFIFSFAIFRNTCYTRLFFHSLRSGLAFATDSLCMRACVQFSTLIFIPACSLLFLIYYITSQIYNWAFYFIRNQRTMNENT